MVMKVLGNRILPTNSGRQPGRRAIAYIVLWGLGAFLTSQSLLRRISHEGFGTETSVISSLPFQFFPQPSHCIFFPTPCSLSSLKQPTESSWPLMCRGVAPAMAHEQPTRCHILEEKWILLPPATINIQQLLNSGAPPCHLR